MNQLTDLEIENFSFRGLGPQVLLGTASDRYAGWIGQIYSRDRYTGKIQSRAKTVAGEHLREEVLPVESVQEYFEHFPCLEVDFTFYRALLDLELKPTANFHALAAYKKYLTPAHRLLLKVPQEIFAQKVMRGSQFQQNPEYLNPDIFTSRFYIPACELLDENIAAFIFEQEYQSKKSGPPPEQVVEDLERFFSRLPSDRRYHVEVRTPRYLGAPYFDFLQSRGIGQVLSHWTWLPQLKVQFEKSGRRFFNPLSVIRLMTPLRMKYDDSYLKAWPFDAEVPGMMSHIMLDDAVDIIREALLAQNRICVIINNRAGGNAPMIAQHLSRRLRPLSDAR